MTKRINELLEGKNFDELVTIYEGFIEREDNQTIENMIVDAMEIADFDKFIEWAA